jgi:maltooligosyltrehalose synthase
MKVSKEMYKDEKMNNEWRMAGVYGYDKNKKIAKAATDSTKKYTQKSLENIKNLNRKK